MRLATLKNKTRDGELIIVSEDAQSYVSAAELYPHMQSALESWSEALPQLTELQKKLDQGELKALKFSPELVHSPLPRAYQWVDGSAFIHHIKLVRMARGAALPETLKTVPLMYQGGSDDFLAPTSDIPQRDFSHGTDFEGEVAVITTDVPMGVSATQALNHVALIMLVNDVSSRGLIPAELKNGFGFLQSKPSSAFSPLAITPDELGASWKEGRVHLPLNVTYNGEFFGKANAKEMFFNFGELIAHAAKTRNLCAGTIVGSGTVSNESPEAGSSCLAEKRMIEKINEGEFKTEFMKAGDQIKINMLDLNNKNLFGDINQKVVAVD